ncbi:hypothetical protein PUN28_001343 [Cardiocondyla obscurior]|uniref:Uncharacterized protein n=1 Tax=Cardiocondyla obscurior TaxID=286306 RepID=A0AAW2H4H8_9HYME
MTVGTNNIGERAETIGFILRDIGTILSRAKTVYSANVVFANVRATKYVTRTYILLDTCGNKHFSAGCQKHQRLPRRNGSLALLCELIARTFSP